MENVSTRKSRREIRKEARLAKNVQRHESWVQHKKSQKLKRAQQSKKNFGDSASSHMNRSEHPYDEKSRNNTEDILFAADLGGDQILANTYVGKEVETKPDLRKDSSSKASKKVKRGTGLKKRSKTKFEEFVELELKNADVLAQEDLEMERRLAKKLKVKEGKLKGVDDELNLLFEGIPALGDSLDRDPDTEEFPAQGFEKGTTKKRSKKRKEENSSVNDITHNLSGGDFESEEPSDAEKELEESNNDANSLKNSRKKRKKKRQEGSIKGGTTDNADNLLGVSEPEDMSAAERDLELVNGTLSPKRRKKKTKSQEEESDVAGNQILGSSMPTETHDAEMNSEDTPISAHAEGSSVRYRHSQLRFLAKEDPEEQVRFQISGLLHRMVEDNVESVTGQIAAISGSLSRSVSSQVISDKVLALFSSSIRSTELNAATFAAFVAAMTCSTGMDFSAKFLASLAKSFQDNYHHKEKVNLHNLILLLSYLCIFGVCSSDLIYDFLTALGKELTEIDVFVIKTVLEYCGMKLRSDDPTAMKDFIQSIQKKVNELKATHGENLAKICGNDIESMLKRISDIKNNKRPKEDTLQHTRIKKWLQKLKVEEIIIKGLKWSKLLDPDKKGQWWLLGGMATEANDVKEVANRIDKEAIEAQKMLQLAASQGMNTDTRKAIFCIIMSAEDYVDAFEKLLRLDLHGKQDRDIMRVLLECCLQEKVFNKYYTVLASKLCEHDRNQKYTLQYCIWDQYNDLDSMELLRSMHLAKFVAEMVAGFSISLSVLKKIDLIEAGQLTPKTVIHFRMFFDAIFEYPDKLVWNMFTRIAIDPELEILRNGIEFFIKKFVLKSNTAIADKFKIAKKALKNMEGVLM